jgi:hypothetical protein
MDDRPLSLSLSLSLFLRVVARYPGYIPLLSTTKIPSPLPRDHPSPRAELSAWSAERIAATSCRIAPNCAIAHGHVGRMFIRARSALDQPVDKRAGQGFNRCGYARVTRRESRENQTHGADSSGFDSALEDRDVGRCDKDGTTDR